MKGLFDASALVNLAINGGSKAADAIAEGSGISLTFYEIGNSVWKLHYLLKKLSHDDAKSLLETSLQLFGRLDILNLTASDAIQVEELASVRKVTFYDSSYLYAAKKNKLALVTDDERLTRAAHHETIATFSSASIL